MSLLEKKLRDSMQKKSCVDIYRDCFDEDSILGIVISFSQNFVLLNNFNDSGEYDGLTIIRTSDITRIRLKSNEIISLEKLIRKKNSINGFSNLDISTFSLTLLLKHFNEKFPYLVLHTEEINAEVCFLGDVLEQSDTYIFLKEYGTMDVLCRPELLVCIEDITRIDVDTKYGNDIVSLY